EVVEPLTWPVRVRPTLPEVLGVEPDLLIGQLAVCKAEVVSGYYAPGRPLTLPAGAAGFRSASREFGDEGDGIRELASLHVLHQLDEVGAVVAPVVLSGAC